MRAYPPPSFVFLAFLGAEIAGGQNMPPPSRTRNSQTLSRGRVNLAAAGPTRHPPAAGGGGGAYSCHPLLLR